MRILTFTSLFPNEAEPTKGIFISRRMSHFARRTGNEVVVMAPVPYVPAWLDSQRWRSFTRVPRHERIGNLETYHPRYPLIPKIAMVAHGYLMLSGSAALARRLHELAPFDLIDAHYVFPDGFAAALLGKLLNVPVIVSARGTDMNLFPSFPSIRPMIRWTLRQVVGGIAVSTALQHAVIQHGLAQEKAAVIANGVDVSLFHAVDRALARECLAIPQDKEVIVSVGGLVEAKGHHLLISAFAEILPRHPRLQLYIIGGGPLRDKLQSLIANYDLQDRVILKGTQPNEQLKYWYSAADISALTSSREGLPNVIVESLACGTPVVATRVGGVPEVINSQQLGALVDQNVTSIAQGLDLALARPWNRELIAQHAQQRTWDVVAEELEQFFQERLGVGVESVSDTA